MDNNIEYILDSKASKMNFMNGLILLAQADGVIDNQEEQFFINAATGLGLQDEEIRLLKENIENNAFSIKINFVNKKQTLFFIKEAMQLSYLDNNYSIEERNIIEEIAKLNSISKSSIEVIENWVIEGIQWKSSGEKLLDLES